MRSVVVVLPASMCAMIPMFRVFWRVNLRGMAGGVVGAAGLPGKEKGPLGPTRVTDLVWTGPRRYLLGVSILGSGSAGPCTQTCAFPRRAHPTIAGDSGEKGGSKRFRAPTEALAGAYQR